MIEGVTVYSESEKTPYLDLWKAVFFASLESALPEQAVKIANNATENLPRPVEREMYLLSIGSKK